MKIAPIRIGQVTLLPRFWLFCPSLIVALSFWTAAGLQYSYVEFLPGPPTLTRHPTNGSNVYVLSMRQIKEFFPQRLWFNTLGGLFSLGAIASLSGIRRDEELAPEDDRPAPVPTKKPLAVKPAIAPPPPPEPIPVSEWLGETELFSPIAPEPEPEPAIEFSQPPTMAGDDSDLWAPPTPAGFQLPEEDPDEWIERFIRQRHVRIVGLPGSGKSFLSIRLLQEDLRAGAKIAICDRHYLKPLRDRKTGAILLHEDGTPRLSDWNGFPRESIFCEQGEIARVITEFRDELKRRQKICRTCVPGDPLLKEVTKPWFLYFDELDATLTDFKTSGMDTVLSDLAILIAEGDGFSVGVRLIGQSLACSASQISEAMNGQLCVVMLGRTAVNVTEVGKLKLAKAESESLIARVRCLNEAQKWGAIVQFKSDPAEAVSVPDLSALDQYRFDREVDPCPTCPADLTIVNPTFPEQPQAVAEEVAA